LGHLRGKILFLRAVKSSFVLLATVAFVLGASQGGEAHLPIYEAGGDSYEEALEIPDVAVSYAIYAEVNQRDLDGVVHYYAVEASQEDELRIELMVPALDYQDRYAPDVILIGHGLDAPDDENQTVLDTLGVSLPAGTGMSRWTFEGASEGFLPEGAPNHEEFEPFGQVVLWERQSASLRLPSAGTYYILVAALYPVALDGDVESGTEPMRYLLVTGYEESFGFGDFVTIPFDWIRIRVFWGENPAVFMLPTLLTVAVGTAATMWYIRTRKPEFLSSTSTGSKAAFLAGLGAGLSMIGGGLNQLLFLLGSPFFDIASIAALVLAFQVLAVFLGLAAIRSVSSLVARPRLEGVVLPSIVFVAALTVGAGFIVGPVVFIAASVALVAIGRIT